ncbi:MAG: hypothetical protein HN904_10940 [Victivallales bacterium]|jgi:hypothetical protein|nr:hypothetical protein [Victivallales bacterium]
MVHLHARVIGALTICCAALCAGQDPAPRLLKVFLADFEDIPHPPTYTREYFTDLFFGLGSPRVTPEGKPIAGSVREYFLELSDGRIEIAGEVAEWVRIPRQITHIPHWKRGMKPFGESWPVIVAETLRAHGVTGPDCRRKLRLADGRMPELLVFLNTDWGIGGVNRGWRKLKEVLKRMGLEELWDENWLGLPSPYSSYSATIWRQAPRRAKDGTIDKIPPAAELELFPLSIMMHEMAHQLAGLPDLYGPSYAPWGVFDLMGGPAAHTHFSMGIASFQRQRKGWMSFTEIAPTGSRVFHLRPMKAHKEALRFQQGPGQEGIVIENRACLRYPRDYSQPPRDDGPRLLVYRYDPAGRAQRTSRGRAVKRYTSIYRRKGHYGEVWGKVPFTSLAAATKPGSRNSLGELWWEFSEMAIAPKQTIAFKASCRAQNLVAEAAKAVWTDQSGKVIAVAAKGDVESQVIVRQKGEAEQSVLHCRPLPGRRVIGRYALATSQPSRLYLVLAPETDPSDGARLSISADKQPLLTDWSPVPGVARGLVLDIPAGATDLSLAVSAPAEAGPDRGVSIQSACVVGLPPTLAELLPDAPASPSVAFDGFSYGPRCLSVNTAEAKGKHILRFPLPAALPAGADLRAVVALAAGTPNGAKARVSLDFEADGKTVPGVRRMSLHMRKPGARSHLPLVVETTVPSAVRVAGKAEVVLTVEQSGGTPSVVLIPCLRVTGD